MATLRAEQCGRSPSIGCRLWAWIAAAVLGDGVSGELRLKLEHSGLDVVADEPWSSGSRQDIAPWHLSRVDHLSLRHTPGTHSTRKLFHAVSLFVQSELYLLYYKYCTVLYRTVL
jgi:hypothetical protein